MPLVDILRSLRTAADLPRLAEALGAQPRWEEIPVQQWLGALAAERLGRVWCVGSADGLRWMGFEGREPEQQARLLMQRLLGRGEFAGVLALDGGTGILAIAAGVDSIEVRRCRLPDPDPVTRACLERAANPPPGGGLLLAAHYAEALSGQAVGIRFFERFRATLAAMAAAMDTGAGGADRHHLALVQLTRILFLYFVQAKGWLDRRPRFLREEVESCVRRQRRIDRDLLRPLFFGTLNRPVSHRGRARIFGRIPFLNGGLFEPHPLERRWRCAIPNEAWLAAFDELFERFHFTVAESAPAGAIAPDMLGRTFEGVMAPEVRRASGTFYTPAPLVREMLDAAFAALVAGRLRCSDSEATRRLDDADPVVVHTLAGATILDPAAGSGAFLLGALERLAELRAGGRAPGSLLKREILGRNLFGVDLNPMAVRLSELRLWLAVIADDAAGSAEAVEPLPNLDCLIRQGDSLLDPACALGPLAPSVPAAARMLFDLRRRFLVSSGSEKREAARRLRRAEAAALDATLREAGQRLELEIADCLGEARSPTLFGTRRGIDRELRARLTKLRERRRRLRRLARQVRREAGVPWFQYEAHFADVFASGGGFDLVVGNPPWVRAEQLESDIRSRLALRFEWWRGAEHGGFRHQADLAIAFLQRAHELVRPGGVTALLLPAKIASAGYGTPARRALATGTSIHAVADLTARYGAAFEATVYPLALVTSATRPDPEHEVRTTLAPRSAPALRQSALSGGAPWVLANHELREALDAVHAAHPRIGDRLVVQLGVKTGANDVFLDPEGPVEPALLRPAVRGRDIRPFRVVSRLQMLWPHRPDGRVLDRLPPLAEAYLRPHHSMLRARADYAGGPPWTLFRVGAAAGRHRVVWADLNRRLSAAVLPDHREYGWIPLNSSYVVALKSTQEARALAAWLNSTALRAAARMIAVPASGGFARFNAATIRALPLPDDILTNEQLAGIASNPAGGAGLQRQLDDLASRLLGLGVGQQRALSRVAGVVADARR